MKILGSSGGTIRKGAITMTENEAIKIATHCLGVLAEQEVCEECPVYTESGIVCEEIVRTAISALKEIQQYRENEIVEKCQKAWESGYDVGYANGYDDGYALGIT